MTQIQIAEAGVLKAKADLKTFLVSLKDAEGNFKSISAEEDTKLKEYEAAVTNAETSFETVKRLHALDSQNATNNTTHTKTFSMTEEEVKTTKTSDTQVKAFALPRTSSVKSFRDIPGGFTKEEQAYRMGRWAAAVIGKDIKSISWCQENGLEIKAMTENVNTAGGFLVPDEFSTTLIDLREQYGVLRKFAQIEPMARDTKLIPRRTGGLTTYWVGEGASITASDVSLDQVQLTAKKLVALAVFSNELSEDAFISIGDMLAREIAYAFAKAEDAAGFMGDGTSTYGGITGITQKFLNLSATRANIAGLYVATGNLPSEVVLADLVNVPGLLPEYVDTNSCAWYMHKSYYWNVGMRLALAAGGVTANEINNTAYTKSPMLLGYPVIYVQSMTSAIGDAVATDLVTILFGDMSRAVTLGDRRQTTLMPSEHYKFDTDQLAIRGTERLDINVHDIGNASGTAALRVPGPLVGLLMKAS